jgi:predicted Rossmann fold flavoprotein
VSASSAGIQCDVAIVGAGAAGLATAIFAARRRPDLRIVALDGAKKIGAKILVSGGGRCNVTNAVVAADDFFGGSRNTVRRVLSALPVAATRAFFDEIGVALHEEENGKLFPDSNSARTVVAALLDDCTRLGVQILTEHRVRAIEQSKDGFRLATSGAAVQARVVALATGGLSLPKTGSDGGGYTLARALGHTLVPTTPALAPLVLDGTLCSGLSGVSQDVEIVARRDGAKLYRRRGAMLWTHFGISGPEPMNVSRVWHRARIERSEARVSANLLPNHTIESAEAALIETARTHPRQSLAAALANWLPARVADALLVHLAVDGSVPLAHLPRDIRRRVLAALCDWPLPVRDSRGYGYAEATAGGVPLTEIDPATMQSRTCPGLFLVGEILDVDGRIGGFNFQWAWSSGFVAALGIDRALSWSDPRP